MTPSNANTSGLVFVGEARSMPGASMFTMAAFKASDVPVGTLLVTAASAKARIAELETENDVLKVEVIGLRAAIFGSHDYDPALRHGNFIEMARATEDGRQGALARATAAEARADRLAAGMPDLSSVIGWLANGCDPTHAVTELRILQARIKAALQQEG